MTEKVEVIENAKGGSSNFFENYNKQSFLFIGKQEMEKIIKKIGNCDEIVFNKALLKVEEISKEMDGNELDLIKFFRKYKKQKDMYISEANMTKMLKSSVSVSFKKALLNSYEIRKNLEKGSVLANRITKLENLIESISKKEREESLTKKEKRKKYVKVYGLRVGMKSMDNNVDADELEIVIRKVEDYLEIKKENENISFEEIRMLIKDFQKGDFLA